MIFPSDSRALQSTERHADREVVIETVAGIACAFSLGGRWSRAELGHRLAAIAYLTPAHRLSYWAQALIGTPFQFESKLPLIRPGTLRVTLDTLDCVTFIYTVVAMSLSTTVEEFVRHLALLRYDLPNLQTPLDEDSANGNFLDFVEESLLERAVERGWLEDVTVELAPTPALMTLGVSLQSVRRPAAFDAQEQQVRPRRGARTLEHTFIRSSSLPTLDPRNFANGDIIVFAKDPSSSEGDLRHILVRHLGIVKKEDEKLYFIHSSRNFALRPHATQDSPPSHAGVYYDTQHRCEQLGVEFCGAFAGDEHTLKTDVDTLFAMDMTRRRTLTEYACSNFAGVKVLRMRDKRSL